MQALFRGRRRIAVSRVTPAEVSSAVARAWREQRIGERDRDRMLAALADDLPGFDIIEVRAALIRDVQDLVVRFPLRAYDALQLGSALVIKARGVALELWCADGNLAAAARTEGLRTVLLR